MGIPDAFEEGCATAFALAFTHWGLRVVGGEKVIRLRKNPSGARGSSVAAPRLRNGGSLRARGRVCARVKALRTKVGLAISCQGGGSFPLWPFQGFPLPPVRLASAAIRTAADHHAQAHAGQPRPGQARVASGSSATPLATVASAAQARRCYRCYACYAFYAGRGKVSLPGIVKILSPITLRSVRHLSDGGRSYVVGA
jgi:hypothetical protein